MTDRARRLAATLTAISIAASSLALPRSAAAIDKEITSRQLFKKAEAFANDGRWEEACPIFQAAHDVNGTGGTALRTADCYEKIGKYDRALALYQYIVDHRAEDKLADRVHLAEGRVAALKKQLEPPPAPTTSSSALAPVAPPTSTIDAPPPPPPSRVPAWISFGVGGAGLAVGAVTGVLALSEASALKEKCKGSICKDPGWESEKSSAVTKGWISTVAFGVGAAGVVAGVVLLVVTRPKTQAKISEFIGPSGFLLHF